MLLYRIHLKEKLCLSILVKPTPNQSTPRTEFMRVHEKILLKTTNTTSHTLPTYCATSSNKTETFIGSKRSLEQIWKRPQRETKITSAKTTADPTSKCFCCFRSLQCRLLPSQGRTHWKSRPYLHRETLKWERQKYRIVLQVSITQPRLSGLAFSN